MDTMTHLLGRAPGFGTRRGPLGSGLLLDEFSPLVDLERVISDTWISLPCVFLLSS